jgi:chromosome partitioning protein
MHTIALVNQKGGVGKSTTAVNLSAGLALLGRRVLLLDLDPQAHSTVALGLQPKKLGASIYSLLSGAAPLKDVIKPISPGLSIIPSTINLAGGEAELTWQQNPHFILKKAMAELPDAVYEYVIVDSPPQLGFLNVNSLAWVKHVFIPLTCEFYALHGLSLLVETVERIKAKLNPELEISGVICNQFNARRGLTKDVIADLESHFPGKVMKSRIRVNVRLAEAPSHGMSVHQYAPTSNGSKDYMALAREMLEVLPADASPDVQAELAALKVAASIQKGLISPDPTPAVVLPTWSDSDAAPAVEPVVEAASEAPAAVDAAPVAEAEAPALAEVVASEPAPVADPAPEPLAAAETAPFATSEAADAVVAESVAPAAEPVVEASAPAVDPLAEIMAQAEALSAEASAKAEPAEIEMPPPADTGRVHEPTSPMIVSAAELAAMAPPADAVVDAPAEPAAAAEAAPEEAPAEEARAAEEPVAATVEDQSTRLGFDPYAESSPHLEAAANAEETEPKPEFVSTLPATPVSELRAAISNNAPSTPAPQSTVKPVPALPSVKAASMPFQERLAMAGLKPIVTSKPGSAPPTPEKKGLFGKFWKR